MDLGAAGLRETPFPSSGPPLVWVTNGAHQAALQFLRDTYEHRHGLGLLQGPDGSGKTTVIRRFTESLDEDVAVAIVDGTGRGPADLLQAILTEFGYSAELDSANEQINMLKVVAMQQTSCGRPPLVVIENTQALAPATLRLLCDLALLRVRRRSALRVVLTSNRSIEAIMSAPAMRCVAERITGRFKLGALTMSETTAYLYAKLRAAGAEDPSSVLPMDICDEVHQAALGWPGIIDRVADEAIAKAEACPVPRDCVTQPELPATLNGNKNGGSPFDGDEQPLLYLTHGGKTLRTIAFDKDRLMIGRSEHNDIIIDSRYISRHHALLIRQGATILLMDLNSANGTYVNSRRVSNYVLVHDDVITLGHYRVKFVHPPAVSRSELVGDGFDNTAVMQSLPDLRQMLVRENTEILKLDPDGTFGASGETSD